MDRIAQRTTRSSPSSRTSSTEGVVAYTGPAYPARTTTGSRPQWSRWAWVSTMASIRAGS